MEEWKLCMGISGTFEQKVLLVGSLYCFCFVMGTYFTEIRGKFTLHWRSEVLVETVRGLVPQRGVADMRDGWTPGDVVLRHDSPCTCMRFGLI